MISKFKLALAGRLLAGALLMVGAVGEGRAQGAGPTNPPTAEDFFREAEIAEAVLSPSGERLAITSGSGGVRVGLFIIDLNKSTKPRPIAQYKDADIQAVKWVNDEM